MTDLWSDLEQAVQGTKSDLAVWEKWNEVCSWRHRYLEYEFPVFIRSSLLHAFIYVSEPIRFTYEATSHLSEDQRGIGNVTGFQTPPLRMGPQTKWVDAWIGRESEPEFFVNTLPLDRSFSNGQLYVPPGSLVIFDSLGHSLMTKGCAL